jgi:hypothetical protein
VSQQDNEELIQAADAAHCRASAAHRQLFDLIVELDLTGAWEDCGAQSLTHWLCMRYGISYWKALRWIGAAHALVELPPSRSGLRLGGGGSGQGGGAGPVRHPGDRIPADPVGPGGVGGSGPGQGG